MKQLRLIIDLTKRDIATKYKGSFFGVLWLVITPLLLLQVYSFVFGKIFSSKWEGQSDNFALVLFIGMLSYNIFADTVSKSPSIISGNSNFVKKVVFPIYILPIVTVLSSIFNFLMGLLAWIAMLIVFGAQLHWTILLIPLFIFPIVLIALGASWFFSALGVYFKDVGQFIGILIMVMMFSCPIFYPISAVPEKYRFFFELNPIAASIEMVREVSLFGALPGIDKYLMILGIGFLIFAFGLWFFKKCQKGFSDVI